MIMKKILRSQKIKNSKVDTENQRESEAICNNILEGMEVSEVYSDSQFSEEDEENLEFSTSIFDIFDEVRIKGDGNWFLDHSPLVLLGKKIVMILFQRVKLLRNWMLTPK